MRRFRLHAFGFIMYLVLALLKVASVNFTLNEYMMMMMMTTASVKYVIHNSSVKRWTCGYKVVGSTLGRVAVK